jgi:twitching motility protein PilT
VLPIPGQAAMELDVLLKGASERGASDVHLKLRQPPVVRVDGALEPLDGWEPLTETDLAHALQAVVESSPARLGRMEDGELDLAYSSDGLPRFRVNCFRQRGAVSLAFRVIPDVAPSFGELNLPAGVARLAHEERGLILVTGASGVGKTTTLAAMIDEINRTRRQHIVTVEDPIEFLHHDRNCIVNQREIGIDTVSFHTALRSVLRQDPDVILIGELRDVETAETALQAAETGHLVLSTMHTIDAAETIGRLIEFFPGAKQPQVRSIIAGVLRGVISQRLLPRTDGGRIPAVEVMVMNARIDELIREHKTHELQAAIEEGSFHEMQSFQQALIGLVLSGDVEPELAANASTNKHDFLIELEHSLKRQKAEEKGWVDPRSEHARAGIVR